jgi:hypothetical protein
VSAPDQSIPRQPNGDPYPPDILFLAEIFGCSPAFIMKHPHTYTERTSGTGDPASGSVDPCKFSE